MSAPRVSVPREMPDLRLWLRQLSLRVLWSSIVAIVAGLAGSALGVAWGISLLTFAGGISVGGGLMEVAYYLDGHHGPRRRRPARRRPATGRPRRSAPL